MHAFGVKPFLQPRYPEIVHSLSKQMFCIFYITIVFEMLENTPKHHFWSNGVESIHFLWIHFSQLRYPEIVHWSPKHKFCLFYILKVSKILQNTPKDHYRSKELEWKHLVGNDFRNSVPRNSAFMTETQIFFLFTCRRFMKCSKTLPKNILGPTQYNWCI
jgi:hypothetical protein